MKQPFFSGAFPVTSTPHVAFAGDGTFSAAKDDLAVIKSGARRGSHHLS